MATNPKRLKLSGNKLAWHQDELKKWKNNEPFPCLYVEFGPTSACNHKCVHCYVQEAVKKPISIRSDVYLRFMREIGEYGVKAIVLGGCGEPLLHPATPKAIETAVLNKTDVGMLTNGVLIKDKDIPILMENLTYMRFSITGGSAESYSAIHKCPPEEWNKIREIMKKCVDYRNKNNAKCTLGAYTLISDKNLYELEDWAKEVKEIGFDYIIIKPPAPGLDKKVFVEQADLDKVKPFLGKIKELDDENFKVMIRMDLFEDQGKCEREYGECLGLPFMCAIDSDGSIYACNWYWGNPDFTYGNLYNQTFPEIWEGQKKQEILKKVSSPGFNMDKCGECRQNNINKWLWKVKKGELPLTLPNEEPPDHINFI